MNVMNTMAMTSQQTVRCKSLTFQSIFQDKNAMKQHQKLNSHAQDGQHLQIIY